MIAEERGEGKKRKAIRREEKGRQDEGKEDKHARTNEVIVSLLEGFKYWGLLSLLSRLTESRDSRTA